jgi:hypothetical protein
MVPKSVGGSIRITAGTQLRLQAGGVVNLNVLKRLDGNKWAVAIQGRVFPAHSDLELIPGSIIRARVESLGKTIVLNLNKAAVEPAQAALLRQGLQGGALEALAAAALVRAGQSVNAESVEKMKGFLSRTKLPKEKAARSLAAMMDKDIDITGPGAERLVAAINFPSDGGGRRRGGGGKRDLPRDPAAVKKELDYLPVSSPKEAGGIAVFNHIRGRSQSWVVLPFLYREGEYEYPGTMKILFDPFLRRARAFVLSIAPAGGVELAFHLRLDGNKRMTVFCGDRRIRSALSRGMGGFTSKFHNMGIEVDDTIHGEDSFDGFSPLWEGATVRGVDTAG